MQVTAPTFTPAPAPTKAPTAAPPPATYTDPFAYCAAVQNLDAPDARGFLSNFWYAIPGN